MKTRLLCIVKITSYLINLSNKNLVLIDTKRYIIYHTNKYVYIYNT